MNPVCAASSNPIRSIYPSRWEPDANQVATVGVVGADLPECSIDDLVPRSIDLPGSSARFERLHGSLMSIYCHRLHTAYPWRRPTDIDLPEQWRVVSLHAPTEFNE